MYVAVCACVCMHTHNVETVYFLPHVRKPSLQIAMCANIIKTIENGIDSSSTAHWNTSSSPLLKIMI